jgi:hypothetical protein
MSASPMQTRRRRGGTAPSRHFSRALALGFPPAVGAVRTGAGGDDTLCTIPGSMGIPGGIGGVSMLMYVGAGVGCR